MEAYFIVTKLKYLSWSLRVADSPANNQAISKNSHIVVLTELDEQIRAHEKHDTAQSFLGWAINAAWGKDDNSLKELKEVQANVRSAPINKTSNIHQLDDTRIKELVTRDKQAVSLQDEITNYSTGFLKTTALFLRGKVGLAGTVALFALDQICPKDSLSNQLTDLALGATKGALLRSTYAGLGQIEAGIAAKGVTLGTTSRLLDFGLSRQTYLDATTGTYSVGTGFNKLLHTTLDRGALTSDVITFGVAHGLIRSTNAFTGNAIKHSPLLSTMLTGSTFGLSSGAAGEVIRQSQSGESFDLSKILARGLVQGTIDTFAAAAGGIQSDARFRQGVGDRLEKTKNAWGERWTDRIARKSATDIVAELQKAGHIAVFAGGCVRDEIMGHRPKDYDVATSATPEQVEKLFVRTIPTGKKHGTITVRLNNTSTEVTTLRADGQYSDGRRPDKVEFLTQANEESLRKDAARRDFTMNAMFKDPITGRIYDFFGGVEDIDRGIIRAVGKASERILEDRLRMMRAARFAARYGFTIDSELEAAVITHASKINGIKNDSAQSKATDDFGERSLLTKPVSGQRIRDEMFKLLASPSPLVGLDFLMKTGLMREILPEVAETNTARGDQDPIWHPEGNTWVHKRMIIDNLSKTKASQELMLGALLHDIGKPETQVRLEGGRISNHGHAEVGAEMALKIAQRWRLTLEQTEQITTLVRLHMDMHYAPTWRPGKLFRLLENPYIEDLIALQHADAISTGCPDRESKSNLKFYHQKLYELRNMSPEPLITGDTLKDLGHKPGPKFKEMLDEAMEAQRLGVFKNKRQADKWVHKKFAVATPSNKLSSSDK